MQAQTIGQEPVKYLRITTPASHKLAQKRKYTRKSVNDQVYQKDENLEHVYHHYNLCFCERFFSCFDFYDWYGLFEAKY